MAYADGESLIETKIQALTNFSDKNTTRGDFTLVNTGESHYCILAPGPFERKQRSMGGNYETLWRTNVHLWVDLQDYKTDLLNLEARRQEIINQFDAWRKAGDTTGKVQDVFVRSGNEVTEVTMPKGNIFIVQILVIEWKEESSATLQE